MANSPQLAVTPGIGRLLAVNVVDPRAREFLLIKPRLTLGNDEANDLVVRDNSVSRRHAVLSFAGGRLRVEDLGSTNGTFLNNRRIDKPAIFDKGDRLRFGAAEFVFVRAASSPAPAAPNPSPPPSAARGRRNRQTKRIAEHARLASLEGAAPREVALARRTAIIGSAPQSAIALEHATVSARHAKLTRRFGRYALRDLGSANGTFVNGQRISAKRPLARGDEVRFGSARFVFLQVPKKRRRARIPPRAALILLLLLFLGALAATEHYIIRELPQPSPAAQAGKTAFAKAAPAAAKPPPPDAAAPDWLRRINSWRTAVGMGAVKIASDAEAGAGDHARYIVKNYLTRTPITPHHEDPENPWFTAAGAAAAQQSNDAEAAGPGAAIGGTHAIDGWIDGPMHRLALLDPHLSSVEFASYCERDACAGVLVLKRPPISSGAPAQVPSPGMFPADRMQLPATDSTLVTDEWPEPLSLSCAGYARPAGYAITLQFDSNFVPKLISYTVSRNGGSIDACGYDSLTYTNGDAATQQWAQTGLKDRGAIVIIPRAPLVRGAQYEVAVTVEAQADPFGWGKPSPFAGQRRSYNWAFTVAP